MTFDRKSLSVSYGYKAAELLKEGKSVTDVAAETGFVNTKYFSSLFKKQFGMQPSKYSGK
ncbi:MAG: helix-turn-helix domain-containing protein [Bacteroides xylanisolvens]